jgi:hypothetical protein
MSDSSEPQSVVPAHDCLRAIKRAVDVVLEKLSPVLDHLYEEPVGPSIPARQLYKTHVLTAC